MPHLPLPWAGLAALWLAQAGPTPAAPAEEPPPAAGLAALEPACDAVARALDGLGSLSVSPLRREGGRRPTADLEAYLARALGRKAPLRLVPPGEALEACRASRIPEELGCLTRRLGVDAALGGTLIQSPTGDELSLLLVDGQGRTLLDQAFPLADLGPPVADPLAEAARLEERLQAARAALRQAPEGIRATSTEAPAEAPEAPAAPPEVLAAPPEVLAAPAPEPGFALPLSGQDDARLAFQLRRLEVRAEGEGWIVVQGTDRRLSELALCQLGGRIDLEERVAAELARVTFRRDLGIGLTLAGAVLAGLSVPFLKAEDDTVFYSGAALIGVGLGTVVAGGTLWGIHGPAADEVERGGAAHHLLEREDAENMIRAHNDALRRELGLPAEGAGQVGFELRLAPLPGGGAAAVGFSF